MQRGKHQCDVRNKLLKSALVLLAKQGVDGVTTRATARLARVSHAAPANHFPDRCAMLTAVAALCLTEMREAASAAAKTGTKPRERLEDYLSACLGYGLRHPERYRLMWRTDLLDAADQNLKAQSDGVLTDIEKLVTALPPPAKGSLTTRVIAVCSMMHGYILMRIDGNFDSFGDETTGRPRHLAMIDAVC